MLQGCMKRYAVAAARGVCCCYSLCCAPEAGLVAAHDGGTSHAEDGVGNLHSIQHAPQALAAASAGPTQSMLDRNQQLQAAQGKVCTPGMHCCSTAVSPQRGVAVHFQLHNEQLGQHYTI